MKRTEIFDTKNLSGKTVCVKGWVHSRRDHGKIVFIDLRDKSGLLQVVFVPGSSAYEKITQVRPEWVISITGEIKDRPESMINNDLETGRIEMEAKELEILNQAKTTPFEIDKDTSKVDEDLRLKYRYLDLRSDRMAKIISLRHETIRFLREYLWKEGFREIETPYLTKSTPEGAREFIVPSRIYPGEFYVLPQSPQQFKQLLMVGGIEKYFQIVRCFRDEDQRGDRQPEFTQLDIEMSFVKQEDIWELVEKMMIELVKTICPQKKITQVPFPRITYNEAMEKYKTDKPDLRKDKNDKKELAFAWIIDVPMFKYSNTDKKLVSSHHLFTSPNSEDLKMLDSEPEKARSCAYDLALNGFEVFGGSIRIHDGKLQKKIFDILQIPEEEVQRRFGHMLNAFEYGVPPHGGIASGIDRLIMVLSEEDNIREVIPFPKTGDAKDLMMGAPSQVTQKQLKDVHIKLAEEAKGKIISQAETQTVD